MNATTGTLLAMQAWLASLSPHFAFLLALPFGVAAAGFAADAFAAAEHPKLRYPRTSR